MNNHLSDHISTPVQLPEYGRNVQKMVAFLKTIESREQRNEQSAVVVGIMSNLSPYKRDTEEFRQMLWDHLFVIADFDLDIDSPYPVPSREQFNPIPSTIAYSKKKVYQKQYGKYAKEMLKAASTDFESTEENQEDIDSIALEMAKFLKQKSYEYNGSHPDNKQVIEYVKSNTDNIAQLDDTAIDKTQVVASQQKKNNNKKR